MPSFSPRRSPGIRRRFVWHQRSGSSPVRGSPVIPLYGGAFGMSRAADRKRHWARIPEGLDILVTHGPPLGILDELGPGRHDGCPELCEAVSQARPRFDPIPFEFLEAVAEVLTRGCQVRAIQLEARAEGFFPRRVEPR